MEKVIKVVEKVEEPTPNLSTTIPSPDRNLDSNGQNKTDMRSKNKNYIFIAAGLLTVILGIASGYSLSGARAGGTDDTLNSTKNADGSITSDKISDEVGTSSETDESAIGVLKEGGIEGEGTHHIDRGLGEEKNVYLTSTVIDLQNYVDKKVEIWGQTISAEYASWMMDVTRIKIVE